MYNRTATVANPGNHSPHEMFYGKIPQTSSISFLKPRYCKYKRMIKMDPKARECFYLGPARNHPRESKSVFVHTGKVIITIKVTWAHVRSGRSSTARSKPSVDREGNESGQDQEGVGQIAKARRRIESQYQGKPQARSRRPRLKRLPRSYREGLQHLLQEPEAANAGFP